MLTGSVPFHGIAPVWGLTKKAVTLRESVGDSATRRAASTTSPKNATTASAARIRSRRRFTATGSRVTENTWYEPLGRRAGADAITVESRAAPSEELLRRFDRRRQSRHRRTQA